jgi:hypothetical protein
LIRKVSQVRKTIASGRIFSTNMHEVCRHLQTLLRSVYCHIYRAKPEDVEFLLVPMPRLEIETIQDFKVLHEIGALSPDMTVKLSRILLGEDPSDSKRGANKRPAIETGNPLPEKPGGQPGEQNNNKQKPAGQPAGSKPAGKP